MRYHVVDNIDNGVLLDSSNIGQWVEWTSVMTDFVTGLHHRTVKCGGYYQGNHIEHSTGWVYAMFKDGHIGGKYQGVLGGPVARFRVPDERF